MKYFKCTSDLGDILSVEKDRVGVLCFNIHSEDMGTTETVLLERLDVVEFVKEIHKLLGE